MYNTPLKTSVTSPTLYTAPKSFLLLPLCLLYSSANEGNILSLHAFSHPSPSLSLPESKQQQKPNRWPMKACSSGPDLELSKALTEVLSMSPGERRSTQTMSMALNRQTQRTRNIRHGRLAENRPLKPYQSLFCQEGVNPTKTEH